VYLLVRALKEGWPKAYGHVVLEVANNPPPFQMTMIRVATRLPEPPPCRSYRALFIVERSERRRSNSAAVHVAHTDL
jgi:hypothetical protein